MPRLLVVGEAAPDGSITKLSTEVATLGRTLAAASGYELEGVVYGKDAAAAAGELAAFLPLVHHDRGWTPDTTVVDIAGAIAASFDGDLILVPASPDGRDIAGAVSALTGMGVLVNATAVRWSDDGPVVEQSAFGGRLITESAFTDLAEGRDHHGPPEQRHRGTVGDRRIGE